MSLSVKIDSPLKIPLKKGGKEGEGEISRRFHAVANTTAVAKPSGVVLMVSRGQTDNPRALRAAPFIKGEFSSNMAGNPEGKTPMNIPREEAREAVRDEVMPLRIKYESMEGK